MSIDSILLLVPDDIPICSTEINTVTLMHPRSGIPNAYAMIGDMILELQSMSPPKFGSFFVGEIAQAMQVFHFYTI